LAPAFKEMCDNCDVELFLILPRAIWFSFLQSPSERADLLRSLLPDRFGGHGAEGAVFDEEVKGFVSRFQSLCSLLQASGSGDGHVMDCLSKRIINGMNTGAGASISDFSFIVAANREEASKATDAFMRDMECWSMELQRHCPEEWNQCTSILLQCLEGTSKSQRA
jgi:hypothetical protein